MDKIKDIISFLNPGQVPVIAADQPIYAVAKHLQRNWPNKYSEDSLVIMFGEIRIEMAVLKSVETLLHDTVGTVVLVEAEVASSGIAESF